MAERETFHSWWRGVPLEERPGLKVLFGIFLIAMTLAVAAFASPYFV
ncbi:hypothetical protein [Henriciella aquimarina]|nr:hypothetical protein [Henriciella aquimarina]